jgi:DNA-binding XRE family transcriptional regulator
MIQSIGLKEFGIRLRSLREQHSYSQGDMANILEISRTSYLAIEQGKRDVGLIEIQKIAVAFQMHLEVLLHGGISAELQYTAREKTIVAGEPKEKYQESELVFNEEKCRALVLYIIEQ